jgi:hypothetical protein
MKDAAPASASGNKWKREQAKTEKEEKKQEVQPCARKISSFRKSSEQQEPHKTQIPSAFY